MSVQAITWALEQTTGSPTGKVILLCLANYADKHGACFPGHNTIARECEVSRRSVVEWMNKLQELGLIVRQRRHREDGSRSSDSVVLMLPEGEASTYGGQSAETAHRSTKVQMTASQGANGRRDKVQQVHTKNRKITFPPTPRSLSGGGSGGGEVEPYLRISGMQNRRLWDACAELWKVERGKPPPTSTMEWAFPERMVREAEAKLKSALKSA